jgi:ABC-type multidrug transport system ATPase subunit
MTEQVQHRAEAIRQVIREHPERGAALLVDFARNFAINTEREDEVILLKIQLAESESTGEKRRIIKQLEAAVDTIAQEYNPAAQQAFAAKENALAQAVRQQTAPDDLVLRAENIVKKYPSSGFTLQLDKLELHLGQITGLVGENATGKTTLLRILAGELAADSGTLRYPLFDPDGRCSWPQLKQKIAFVPQDLPRWHGSLRDNLHYEAARHGLRGEANRKAVDYIVQRLGLGLHLQNDWTELSGGYKLRFSLAKALVWQAQLLIIDEPLAFLDVKTQFIVLNDLRNLTKSLRRPMAVLISSQHLHETEAVADQMLFMRGGRLENLGATSSLGANRKQNVFELGCPLRYADLQKALENFPHHRIWNNGLNWIITTPLSVTGHSLLNHLDQQQISFGYFRDLSHSVKTKFYEDDL